MSILIIALMGITTLSQNPKAQKEIDLFGLIFDNQIDQKRIQYTNPTENSFLFMTRNEVFEISLEDGSVDLVFDAVAELGGDPLIRTAAYVPKNSGISGYPEGFYLISTYDPTASAGKKTQLCLIAAETKGAEPAFQRVFHQYNKALKSWTEHVSVSRIVATYSGEHIFVNQIKDPTFQNTGDWTISEIVISDSENMLRLETKGLPIVKSVNLPDGWLSNFRSFWAFEDNRRNKETEVLAIGELTPHITGLKRNEEFYDTTLGKQYAPHFSETTIRLRMDKYTIPYEKPKKGMGRPWYYSFDRTTGVFPFLDGRDSVLMGIQRPRPNYTWTDENKKAGLALEEPPFILSVNIVDTSGEEGEIIKSFDTQGQEFLIGFDGIGQVFTLLQDPNLSPSLKIRVYNINSTQQNGPR
jgi:hypothetical protein